MNPHFNNEVAQSFTQTGRGAELGQEAWKSGTTDLRLIFLEEEAAIGVVKLPMQSELVVKAEQIMFFFFRSPWYA